MNFGEAIAVMKAGIPISRTGWNGKGMFLYYVPENMYQPTTEVAKARFGGNPVPYRAYIAMKTVDNDVVPWVASQTDILAVDWQIAGDVEYVPMKPAPVAQSWTPCKPIKKVHWTQTPEGKKKMAARKRGGKK